MIELNEQNVAEALREAVRKRGADFVYPEEWTNSLGNCEYVVNGEPACIVGEVLHSLGVPLSRLKPNNSVANKLFQLEHAGVLVYTQGAMRVLRVAQRVQDAGLPWGVTVKKALKAV